jgi:hypothetical protein
MTNSTPNHLKLMRDAARDTRQTLTATRATLASARKTMAETDRVLAGQETMPMPDLAKPDGAMVGRPFAR